MRRNPGYIGPNATSSSYHSHSHSHSHSHAHNHSHTHSNNMKHKPKPARLLNQKNQSASVLIQQQTSSISNESMSNINLNNIHNNIHNNNDLNDGTNNSPLSSASNSSISINNNMKNISNNSASCNQSNQSSHHDTILFGINLSVFSECTVGIILLSIVMLGFILIGLVEEGFKFAFPDFSFGWTMTAVELYIFSVFAVIETLIKEGSDVFFAPTSNLNDLSSMSSINLNNNNKNECDTNKHECKDKRKDNLIYASNTSKISNNNGGNDDFDEFDDFEELGLLKNNKNNTKNELDGNGMKMLTIDEEFDSLYNLNSLNNLSRLSIYRKTRLVLYRVFHRRVPLKFHFQIAVAMTASRGLTNISMLLLNYPTQVIFKSMKLISVMIGSQFFLKKKYVRWDYFAALFMVLSAILFTLGDTRDTRLNFNVLGVVVVLLSLIFDSAHSNGQEWVLNHNAAEGMKNTHLELLLYSNFFSAVLASAVAILYGEVQGLVIFLSKYNVLDVGAWFLIRVLCLYIGVSAFIVFTKRFGAVYAVTATTVRKILTVLLSYVFWPGTKTFTMNHAFGTALFSIAMALNWKGVVVKKSK